MEDEEDDSQIDDECEDMEFEGDMENMVDMYSFFANKKLQTFGSGSSTFSKIIWVEMHHLVHLLLS